MLGAARSRRKVVEMKMSEDFLVDGECNHRAYRWSVRGNRHLVFTPLIREIT